MVEQDIPKTTFWTRCKHFEFVVMSFVLTNTFAVFMNLMNRVFYDCLDKFIMVFIDDILIYSKSHEEYKEQLRLTLQRLKERQLYAKFSKYEFWLDKIAFLEHIVSTKDISIDLSKIKNVRLTEAKNYQRGSKFSGSS